MKKKDVLLKDYFSIEKELELLEEKHIKSWENLQTHLLKNSKRKKDDRFIFKSTKYRIAAVVVIRDEHRFPKDKIGISYYCINDEKASSAWFWDDLIDNKNKK